MTDYTDIHKLLHIVYNLNEIETYSNHCNGDHPFITMMTILSQGVPGNASCIFRVAVHPCSCADYADGAASPMTSMSSGLMVAIATAITPSMAITTLLSLAPLT